MTRRRNRDNFSIMEKRANQKNKEELATRVGNRIRALRQEVGLSVKDLAAAADLSAPFVSRMERGKCMASVPALQLIADALKVDIASFFEPAEKTRFTITRRGDRRSLLSFRGRNSRICYQMEPLAENMLDPLMEPALVTELVDDLDESELTSHGGQEFCMVIEGSVEIILGHHRFLLEEGDSAYWDGHIPHGAARRGSDKARTLNVHIIPGQRTGSFSLQDIPLGDGDLPPEKSE